MCQISSEGAPPADAVMMFFLPLILLGVEVYSTGPLAAELTAIQMMFVLPLILLSVAPAKAISRRLIFLALGLLLLIGLNQLSKLGLDVTAPKLRG